MSLLKSRSGRAAFCVTMVMVLVLTCAAAPSRATPALFGAPLEYFLFGLMLVGIAALHHHARTVALIGLAVILAYEALVSGFPTGYGAAALGRHIEHEWVTFANLFLLLVGFEVLSNQFE